MQFQDVMDLQNMLQACVHKRLYTNVIYIIISILEVCWVLNNQNFSARYFCGYND